MVKAKTKVPHSKRRGTAPGSNDKSLPAPAAPHLPSKAFLAALEAMGKIKKTGGGRWRKK